MRARTTRICAGEYEVRLIAGIAPWLAVRVTKVHYPGDGIYWIAAANWDEHLHTDPLATKRDAAFNAKRMFEDRLGGTVE